MPEPDVLITSDASKLPADIAALLDPSFPLPPGVIFFEKRFEMRETLTRLLMAAGFAGLAVILIPFGIYCIFSGPQLTQASTLDYLPLIFGGVCALATWMTFASINVAQAMRRRQKAGQSTRYGTFLSLAAIIQVSESDITVIPPGRFLGLDGNSVKYQHNNVAKSYRLPSAWMNATREQVQAAILQWASTTSAAHETPPPLPA